MHAWRPIQILVGRPDFKRLYLCYFLFSLIFVKAYPSGFFGNLSRQTKVIVLSSSSFRCWVLGRHSVLFLGVSEVGWILVCVVNLSLNIVKNEYENFVWTAFNLFKRFNSWELLLGLKVYFLLFFFSLFFWKESFNVSYEYLPKISSLTLAGSVIN